MATRNLLGDVDNPFFLEAIQRGEAMTSEGSLKKVLNVFHFRRTSNGNPVVIAHVHTATLATIQTALMAALNARYHRLGFSYRLMDDPDNMATDIDSTANGGNDDDSLSLGLAVKIGLTTASRGASFRGSKHFAPASESDSESDELSADGITAWAAVQTAINSMASVTDSDGNNWKAIVLSRTLSDLEARPAVFTFDDVTGSTLNLTLGSMKHRREKYKKNA
jgi:hypothetical protein